MAAVGKAVGADAAVVLALVAGLAVAAQAYNDGAGLDVFV
jgi:hypothetical protein